MVQRPWPNRQASARASTVIVKGTGRRWPLTPRKGRSVPARVPRVGKSVVSKDVQDRRIKVIRELWFTDCTLTAIGVRLGMHRNAVAKLAKQVGLPPRH